MYKLITDVDSDILIFKDELEILRLKSKSVFHTYCEIYLENQLVLTYKYYNIFSMEYFKIINNNLLNKISFNNKFKLNVVYENKLIEIQFLWFPFIRRKIGKIFLNKSEIAYIINSKSYSLEIHFIEGNGDIEIISLILLLIKRNFDSWM